MATHLGIDAPTGRIAVWTGNPDVGPLLSPASYPTRVKFNSALDNLGFVGTPKTGRVTVVPGARKTTLFAHRLGYRPLLMGTLTVAGKAVPINGSVPLRLGKFWHILTIGADATNVYLNVTYSGNDSVNEPASATSSAVSYSIYLSTYGVTSAGALRRPPYFNGVDINAGASTPYIKAGYFSTEWRYVRRLTSGAIKIPRGRTMVFAVGGRPGSGGFIKNMAVGFRYAVNGYVAEYVTYVARSRDFFVSPLRKPYITTFVALLTSLAL
jgi:hypothetical protein